MWLLLKAAVSGLLIAAASTLAKRYPGFGALIASLPLVSALGMIWLWAEKPDAENMAAHAPIGIGRAMTEYLARAVPKGDAP